MRLRSVAFALRLVLRDLVTILVARRVDGRRPTPASVARELRDYVAALAAYRRQRREQAVARAQRCLRVHDDLRWPLMIVSVIDRRRGELTSSLAATRRLRALVESRSLHRRDLEVSGWLEETEPGWLPRIDAPAAPIEPRAGNVVMHLLKVSLPDRQSGYTIRSREVLRAQVAAGLDPFVVTPYGYPPDRTAAVPGEETIDAIRHHRLAPGAPTDELTPSQLLSRTAELAAVVGREERPAIIHAASGHRGFEGALVGLALREHLRRPLVYEVRGFLEASWTGDASIAVTAAAAEYTRRRLATEDRVMATADGITTLGTAMRDELVSRGLPADKIIVVPNGIDPDAFLPMAPDPELRSRYGLTDRWVFGYVSNMDHFREGHALLIEATARLVAEGRAVACLLVGDGHLRERLERRVSAAGLRGSVIFTGRVPHDEVRAHESLLDAFVVARVPDRAGWFTTPLKPYEAMAMGVPLVTSDLPALTEIAAPGERGLSFPAGDADALAATLRRLMDAPEHARDLAAAARRWVLAERTWAANGPRYRDLYERVIASYERDADRSPSIRA